MYTNCEGDHGLTVIIIGNEHAKPSLNHLLPLLLK